MIGPKLSWEAIRLPFSSIALLLIYTIPSLSCIVSFGIPIIRLTYNCVSFSSHLNITTSIRCGEEYPHTRWYPQFVFLSALATAGIRQSKLSTGVSTIRWGIKAPYVIFEFQTRLFALIVGNILSDGIYTHSPMNTLTKSNISNIQVPSLANVWNLIRFISIPQ